ncbi:Ig-like domain-containing protein [Streptomyces sp. KS_16]|uniref:L,D-transpeptidase n=1 Tax=unclassified Streptomyces TaxID=2593676 RepID=UPI00089233F3|nr:LOW QUALITY PROTEIN: lipoprotein-anchoring transpeptidase ErfK/SrfK [Streptomyces sp. 2321.6]SDR20997.1 Lipoprotein-anchoring transpeptidase ErfK/SrfK [Streptomyces sp. KS_16]SED58010.1 Lipoprotein-anchoring transpeptidase ErfK/SrfK [Streptomyces sp. 2133.1]SNC71183.1 Lipoprotein-anchoring transpeptidase ErfK/SrfK [Streptomyces sp. 2114.4]
MNVQPNSGVPARRRRWPVTGGGAPALLVGAMLLLVTACGGDVDDDTSAGKAGGEKAASQAAVTIAPKDGAHDVATSGALKVTAHKGRLKSVKVKDGKGNEVDGKTAGGGALWQPSGHLGASTEYTVDAIAVDGKGRETAEHSRFTTLVPKNTFIGQYTPENGQRVGVGMPVSIHFTRGITDPRAVEDAIKVSAQPSVPIEGHWFGNDRLDFRPEKYWAAGTKVTLKLDLNGVEGRPGVYGTQAKEVSFTVGRSQVSTVDAASKKMTVVRDGKKIKTIPITSGAPGTETYNGKMVISEKHLVTRMNGDTVGFGGEYDIKDVPHAMRLSTSGTFIHGNYWSGSATFGTRNASHGCVGLFDQRGGGDSSTPAAWFFRNSVVGDVVIVKNSHDETIQPDNGFSDWNLSWEKWKARQ